MSYGRSFGAVARDPWRETLYAFAMLREHELITERVQQLADVRAAHRVAVAFHEPKRLGEQERHALAALLSPRITDLEYVSRQVAILEARAREGVPVEVDDSGC